MTLIDQLCHHCDGDGCDRCRDGWVKPLDWPAIVFPSGAPPDRVARSKYRLGQVPSGRKMLEWAKAHGLRFVVDADGLRCERVHD